MTKVSVIVPNYNHARYLNQRIDSILRQTYSDFNIIILDDGSSDNSLEVISQYRNHPKVKTIVVNSVNSGSTFSQWIKGILLADGEYVWIAESDDFAGPGFLEAMVLLTNTYRNVAITYCNSYKVDEHGNEMDELHCYMHSEFKAGVEEVKTLALYNTITNASSALIKREYALKALADLQKFKSCGDWIFYARVLQYGNLTYCPRKMNYYRWHPSSVSFSASKTAMYIYEGVQVIKYIDYTRIRFTMREYMSIFKAWVKKVVTLQMKYMPGAMATLLVATFKFFKAKIS